MGYYIRNLAPNQAVLDALGSLRVSIGNEKSFASTMVSYKLDLTGPSVNVDTNPFYLAGGCTKPAKIYWVMTVIWRLLAVCVSRATKSGYALQRRQHYCARWYVSPV